MRFGLLQGALRCYSVVLGLWPALFSLSSFGTNRPHVSLVAILRVLNQENHHERDDGRSRIELQSVREIKSGSLGPQTRMITIAGVKAHSPTPSRNVAQKSGISRFLCFKFFLLSHRLVTSPPNCGVHRKSVSLNWGFGTKNDKLPSVPRGSRPS